MAKLRKQRRRKVFKHNVNRKRLRNKLLSQGDIACKEMKKSWEERKSVKKNLLEMGLSYDPNLSVGHSDPSKPRTPRDDDAWIEEDTSEKAKEKAGVVEELIRDARAPRVKMFRLPKGQVEWITYLLDHHGKDYKAMEGDKKNYKQETWKQLRAKIKRFKSIPEHYLNYLKTSKNPDACVDDECDSDSNI